MAATGRFKYVVVFAYWSELRLNINCHDQRLCYPGEKILREKKQKMKSCFKVL